ncbi:pseudouridine synthase [Novosphingobium terrae]|uniref:pseudouridine synthase n=1 Tax=Novosphingobium terrae TaxID=2726189 RepID=UPI0019826D14|nr:pseudouridine synthase [Novosphingobium terrae]
MAFNPKPPRGPGRPSRPARPAGKSGAQRYGAPRPRDDRAREGADPEKRQRGTLKPVAKGEGWSPDTTPETRLDDRRGRGGRDERGGDRGGQKKAAWGDRTRERHDAQRGEGRGRSGGGFGGRDERASGERSRGGFGDKSRGGFGDKPRGDFGDRPRGNFGDKPRGGFGDKPRGDFGDRPRGNFGDKPRGNFGGDDRRGAFGDKPKGSFGDKARARRADQREERGERSFSTPRGGFGGERSGGFERRDERPRGGFGDRVRSDRGRGDRAAPREEPTPYQRIASLQDFAIDPEGERIAKLLARAGIASRREVERMIVDGRVALDGELVLTPVTILTSLKGLTVDGKPVDEPEVGRLWAFHKPDGLITAERDPAGRPTIYNALRNALPPGTPRLMPVGRLDMNTEGLLLLTNDGELKRAMELPSSGVPRTYRARTFGDITQPQLEELMQGIEIDGFQYGPINANMERRTGRNQWIEVTLTEGKNREVRRVLEHLGLQVSRLLRIAYGPFLLGDLPRGAAVALPQNVVEQFRKGLKG